MNIGEAAERSGLPVKTLRYYEEIGLVTPARSEGNAYRDYSEADIERLRFLQRTRAVGLTLKECRDLLSLYLGESLGNASARVMLMDKIDHVNFHLQQLIELKKTFTDMADKCVDENPDDDKTQYIQSLHRPAFMPFMLVDS